MKLILLLNNSNNNVTVQKGEVILNIPRRINRPGAVYKLYALRQSTICIC